MSMRPIPSAASALSTSLATSLHDRHARPFLPSLAPSLTASETPSLATESALDSRRETSANVAESAFDSRRLHSEQHHRTREGDVRAERLPSPFLRSSVARLEARCSCAASSRGPSRRASKWKNPRVGSRARRSGEGDGHVGGSAGFRPRGPHSQMSLVTERSAAMRRPFRYAAESDHLSPRRLSPRARAGARGSQKRRSSRAFGLPHSPITEAICGETRQRDTPSRVVSDATSQQPTDSERSRGSV